MFLLTHNINTSAVAVPFLCTVLSVEMKSLIILWSVLYGLNKKESDLRFALLALIGSIGLAAAPLSAQAYVAAGNGLNTETSSAIVDVAVHCGPHAHYIRGHRDAHGHYVKGVCVRDRRH